jgi:hypothetical protein
VGDLLKSKKVLFHCDNMSVVFAVNAGTSKCGHIMTLIRELFFTAAKFNFDIRLVHVPGITNIAADLLSRGKVTTFLASFPEAERIQTQPRIGSLSRWYK